MRLGRESFYAVWDMAASEALPYLHAMLTLTSQTAEAAEGIAAFLEKRPPSWQAATDDRRRRTDDRESATHMAKRALITGITGQDGSYLAEFLLEQGYEVIGMVRRSLSTVNFERIAHIQDRLTLVAGDLLDEVSLIDILREHRPAEVYNLAAQSFVQTSWSQPVLTGETTALGVTRVLDAIRIVDPGDPLLPGASSEMFGKVQEVPQTETTPFYPRSPYGVAKVYGHWITVNYRESYGLHASSGILFNHESPRRGLEFVDPQGDPRRGPDQGRPRRASSPSATSTPSATGASPATTCGPCG